MQLSLLLLGPYEASLDGRPIADLYSSKVRGLLAYLAVEAGRPHARPILAALLWPDWSDSAALGNLRFSLSKLRQAIHDQDVRPPFLLVSRDTVQIDPLADFRADVRSLEEHLTASQWQQALAYAPGEAGACREAIECSIRHLEAAVELYRGPFLEGFSCGDSETFEGWALLTRERVEQSVIAALRGLVTLHRRLGDLIAAERYCRRLLALDAWDEEGNVALMTVLAEAGQRNAALRHFAAFRAELAKELSTEPSEKTVALYEMIKGGRTVGAGGALESRVAHAPHPPRASAPVFVARESELAQLERYLHKAFAGDGGVAFVAGEAGSGKSALIAEFARHASRRRPDLVHAGGRCNAYTGIGDPYLPFREIALTLAGAPKSGSGAAGRADEDAQNLQTAPPGAARALIENARDLASRLISTPRGASARSSVTATPLPQADLFAQYTDFLLALAAQQPLLLHLDDLQWADDGSLSLLFHLGRRLSGARVLVLGAYRPEEVMAGRDGARHPLWAVINELGRVHGNAEVDLDQADGRRFVTALLDSETNRIGTAFRDALYHHTGGHALFTTELLRSLQERGELVRDAAGAWVATTSFSGGRLPTRVEAIIAERVASLPEDCQTLLEVASVEGEAFTAEVVASVVGKSEAVVGAYLAGPLRRQRIVISDGLRRVESRRLSRYRFGHSLFQQYLYGRLDAVQRAKWHEEVGGRLAELHGEDSPDAHVQLAWHFEQAGLPARAADHLLAAGRRAMRLAGYREAVAAFERGLELLTKLPETPERAQRELDFRFGLGAAGAPLHHIAHPGQMSTVAPALPLGRQSGGTKMLEALLLEATTSRECSDFARAIALGEQMLGLGEASKDRQSLMLAHYILGTSHFFLSDAEVAHANLEASLRLWSDAEDEPLVAVTSIDVKAIVLSFDLITSWALGYPDKAAARDQEALERAYRLAQPATLMLSLVGSIWLALLGGTGEDPRPKIEALQCVVDEGGLEFGCPWTGVYGGWVLVGQGRVTEGIDRMQQGIAELGSGWGSPVTPLLVETCLKSGQYDQGLSVVNKALGAAEQRGLGLSFEPELHRLRGALVEARGGPGSAQAAEICFLKAIELACARRTRSWELRAAVSLARLWRRQGKARESQELLTGIRNQFTEGSDTPDLVEARAVLEDLQKVY